jgi:hypothetical protein
MIDENFYQKRVDELRKSLKSKTVFINESFSGGLFRTSAKPFLNDLSIYHLLRGLEIDTDSETYEKIGTTIPTLKELFSESTAETEKASGIVVKQLEYIRDEINKLDKNISDEVSAFLKENKEDIAKLKATINSLKGRDTLIGEYINSLTGKVSGDQTGLKDDVYDAIDKMGLKDLEPENFKLDFKVWLKEADINQTVESNITINNPITRISMMLEMVLKSMNIDGLKFTTFSDNAYDYLKSVVGTVESKISESKIEGFKDFLNNISKEIVKEQLGQLENTHKKAITIPTLQSLFISLVTILILKAIANSSSDAVTGQGQTTQPQSTLSEKVQVKAKAIITAYDELEKLGFFQSEKVFYEKPKKPYSISEKDMIVSLKKLFSEMGLLPKSSSYINRGSFDKDILGEAVKTFQSSVEINGDKLKSDGRIGKNTRLVLATFVKDMKERLEGTGKYAASSSTFNTESASKVKSSEVTSSKPVSVNGISAISSDNQA